MVGSQGDAPQHQGDVRLVSAAQQGSQLRGKPGTAHQHPDQAGGHSTPPSPLPSSPPQEPDAKRQRTQHGYGHVRAPPLLGPAPLRSHPVCATNSPSADVAIATASANVPVTGTGHVTLRSMLTQQLNSSCTPASASLSALESPPTAVAAVSAGQEITRGDVLRPVGGEVAGAGRGQGYSWYAVGAGSGAVTSGAGMTCSGAIAGASPIAVASTIVSTDPNAVAGVVVAGAGANAGVVAGAGGSARGPGTGSGAVKSSPQHSGMFEGCRFVFLTRTHLHVLINKVSHICCCTYIATHIVYCS